MLDFIPAATRKRIYRTTSGLLGLFTVLLPTLIQLQVIPASLAANIASIISGVGAVAGLLLADKNVPTDENIGS